jgi:uncharacterized membrane protein
MEEHLIHIIEYIKLFVEAIGVTFVVIGTIRALVLYLRTLRDRKYKDFADVRLVFARYLVLALEFQLAADILSTAVAPTWEAIGKLAAIAVIRTVLNYFLTKEMEKEKTEVMELESH